MESLNDFSNDGDTWLINAILNEDTFDPQTKEIATGLTYQDRVSDNLSSPPTDLEHEQAMETPLASTITHSHGATTTNTVIQNSSSGDSLDYTNLDQEIDDDESAHRDDDFAQEFNSNAYFGRWINRLTGFASFNEGENEGDSTVSYGGSTECTAALSATSDNDEFPGAPMNRFTPEDEDLTTGPEPNSELSLSEGCSTEDDDSETMEDFRQRLIHWIAQMMFVSGETAEPGPETTWMIEEIVREQVLEMVCPPSLLKHSRNFLERVDSSVLTLETCSFSKLPS